MSIYNEFYKKFIPELTKRLDEFPSYFKGVPNHRKGKPYLGYPTGIGRVQYYTEYTSKGYKQGYTGYIVGVYIDSEDYLEKFQFLEQFKDEIEEKFGSSLVWLDTGRAGRIFVRLDTDIRTDIQEWDNVIEWAISKLIEIVKVFQEYLEKLRTRELSTNENIFYGLWCPRGDSQETIDEIIQTGVWVNKSSSLEKYELMINMKIGAKVFLYQGYEDVPYKETLFAPYIDERELNGTAVHVISHAIGIIKNVEAHNNKLEILWEINYTKKEWYTYIDQKKGVWEFNLNTKNKRQRFFYNELYKIVFEDGEQDYKLWVENGFILSKKENTQEEIYRKKNMELNQILFGPPGTGKTYNTINRALKIIDGDVPEDREDAKKRFEELKSAGQIEFVTFHQSYGYEEFVEGLKASSEDGNISYSVEDGIFKSLCKTAMKSSNFEEVYNKFIEDLSDEELILYTASQHNKFKVSVNSNGNLSLFTGEKLQQNGTLTKERIGKYVYNENPDGYWQGYYKAVVKHLETEYILTIEDNKEKNYILIIDEINRGNISKIFGELITLIEPSKRLGNSEALEVQLPYSHEKFGVPKNLYIIGTMNTADRSIALLDTALRRRFEFVEMMPKSKLLDFIVEGVNIAQLLEKINARVEYLYDRDHTIGHSYFMDLNENATIDDLNHVMRNKIIPLLQEYFYDDWEKILLVLGDGFVEHKTLSISDIFGKDALVDEYIQDDKILYNIKDNFTDEAYKQLIRGSNDNIEY